MLKSRIGKNEAAVIRVMLDAELISYKHYITWADEIIMSDDDPELWILELAANRSTQAAIGIINTYLNSEPFESKGPTYRVSFITCLWLRYKQGELSWSEFLFESGNEVDGNSGRVDCEFFYGMHHEFEGSDNPSRVEDTQSAQVYKLFCDDIEETKSIYDEFSPFYIKYGEVYGA